MPKREKQPKSEPYLKQSPAISDDERESRMIALATDLAEQQLRDGTASSQVITHYLKLATSRERHEIEMLEIQKELAEAKIQSLRAAKSVEELYANAISAMRHYGGSDED